MAFHIRSRYFNAAISAAAIVVVSAILLIPVNAATGGDATRGQAVFIKNSCVTCHANGENSIEPEHPIKGAAFQQKYKDDLVLEKTIRTGFAQYGMPSFTKTMINDNDMRDLIAYVRTLSSPAKKSK